MGNPSTGFGRLKWKWSSMENLICLVEAIKRVDQESKQHPKERMGFQVVLF
jgi:hypothetical protein